MRKLIIVLFCSIFCAFSASAENTYTYHITPADIYKGYITEKVWLTHYAMPQVALSDMIFTTIPVLPANATTGDPEQFGITMGMERKRPFILLHIPVYKASGKEYTQLTEFKLVVTESTPATPAVTGNKMARTTATGSVLASGNWFKIGVTNTGLYKVDYDFLVNSGISTTGITLSNIRVFGNGGSMLSENNAISRINDLAENAIWVNDKNGNGTFDKGDYFVFYAQASTGWVKDSSNSRFVHVTNIYADTAYYFLNFDAPGLRVNTQNSVPTGNVTVNNYDDYLLYEKELTNVGPFGRQWWGEQFSGDPGKTLTRTFSFTLGPVTGNLRYNISLGNQSPLDGNVFKAYLNSQLLGSATLVSAAKNAGDFAISPGTISGTTTMTGNIANIQLTYQPNGGTGTGYLDFIELNYRRALTFTDAEMNIRDWSSVGAGKVATYQLQGASSATQVWDVTNPQAPVKMNGTLSGGTYTFTQDAARLHEFAAMNSDALYTPSYAGQVPNQNLHGMGQVDFIIVTDPLFLDAANRLADFHRNSDHIRVAVATTAQIYNEFSSGAQDLSAIRDFAKMFYDRAGTDTTQLPRNLLLFGDASYDYKNRIANNGNHVPTFESPESMDPINSFAGDDFFSFLDDNENIENTSLFNAMDVGVGRLPVNNINDAEAAVDKVIAYKSPASLGPWRISASVVADNEDDAGPHMSDAENISNIVKSKTTIYNFNKIYVDAIPAISTPGGYRAPNGNQALDNAVYKGTFFINYTGHGNTEVWASERILTQNDYNSWNNIYKLPFTITATCDFGQFDNPAFVSAGEGLVVKNNGGVIVALTTTQETYESQNKIIDQDFVSSQFTHHADGSWNTFGEAFRKSKNLTYTTSAGDLSNFRKFALLGDPAVLPDFPKYNIRTESIKNGTTQQLLDTVSALGAYTIGGSVVDAANNVLTDFNGTLYVTIFDKSRTIPTITGIGKTFDLQDNIIYKGKITVTAGHFSYTFITPKDINYIMGNGRISYYADNGIVDAAGGEDTIIVVGGYSKDPINSDHSPIVKPFMNDTLFQNGGITGSNSVLYVQFYSETGINVSGNVVGHDLTAVLDNNVQNPYILNDFYETLPNTYQHGFASFPVTGLSVGKHTLTVKAWDVNDNSGTGTVEFEVIDSNVVKVLNISTYPNPFRDVTHFVFDHNHPGEQLDVNINIYNTSGVLVRNLEGSFVATGSRSADITWDGTGNSGAPLPSGVYLCRIKVATQKGIEDLAYQKVVLIR